MSYKLLRAIFGLDNPDTIGWIGESKIEEKLFWADLFGKKGEVLRNIYVPREDGTTSEIDLLYITTKGILVIESKNYSGYIFGSGNSKNWTSSLYAGKNWLGMKQTEKHQFYNPIWQNKTHIKYLQKYLNFFVPMYSIIVFSERCELKSVSYSDPDTYVCKRNSLGQIVSGIWNANPDYISEDDVNRIRDLLLPLTNSDEATKAMHVENIETKYKNPTACPLCGGNLVVRTARQGKNAGSQFLGCSNYPRCKFTKPMN